MGDKFDVEKARLATVWIRAKATAYGVSFADESGLTLAASLLESAIQMAEERPSVDDIMSAVRDIAEAAESGAALRDDLKDIEAQPWRWQYPSQSISDDSAYWYAKDAAQLARRGLCRLGIAGLDPPQEG